MPVFPDDPSQRELGLLPTSEFGVCIANQTANPKIRRSNEISALLRLARQGKNVI